MRELRGSFGCAEDSSDLRRPRGRAYYMLERSLRPDGEAFTVWLHAAGGSQATLIGRYTTIVAAMSSVPADWRDAASPEVLAWAFVEPRLSG